MSLTLEQAVDALCADVAPLPQEAATLPEALGRVLAADVASPIDQPPFPRSPLDGYALLASDTAAASRENPVPLLVTGKVYAGQYAGVPVTPGTAVRVMTGSMLPAGCDCVIRQEDTDSGEETVHIFKAMRAFDNYVYQGEDFRAGSTLLPRGTRMDAAACAIAASAGVMKVQVPLRPRVSVICTGDELVEPGVPLPAGKIYNSNLFYIGSRLRELGAELVLATSAGDSEDKIASGIRYAAAHSDLVITTGGVSVGQKDLLPIVTEHLGAKTVFHGVAMKPGSPVLYTRLHGVPVLSLSGNPFAAATTFELLARPLLAKLTEDDRLPPRRAEAKLLTPFPKRSMGRRLIRGIYEDGCVRLPEGHSSGQLRSMLGCNCLVDIPAGTAALEAGESVSVLLL